MFWWCFCSVYLLMMNAGSFFQGGLWPILAVCTWTNTSTYTSWLRKKPFIHAVIRNCRPICSWTCNESEIGPAVASCRWTDVENYRNEGGNSNAKDRRHDHQEEARGKKWGFNLQEEDSETTNRSLCKLLVPMCLFSSAYPKFYCLVGVWGKWGTRITAILSVFSIILCFYKKIIILAFSWQWRISTRKQLHPQSLMPLSRKCLLIRTLMLGLAAWWRAILSTNYSHFRCASLFVW